MPCSAREIELRLHTFCDHHGAWDSNCEMEDTSDGEKVLRLIIED